MSWNSSQPLVVDHQLRALNSDIAQWVFQLVHTQSVCIVVRMIWSRRQIVSQLSELEKVTAHLQLVLSIRKWELNQTFPSCESLASETPL